MANSGSIKPIQFAKWSFERDRSRGLYDPTMTWDGIDEDDRNEYLWEAEHYIKNVHPTEWPEEILTKRTRV